ncbi:hypothetical protein IAR50_006336 [Cryptococcus sp. DSM 104548]
MIIAWYHFVRCAQHRRYLLYSHSRSSRVHNLPKNQPHDHPRQRPLHHLHPHPSLHLQKTQRAPHHLGQKEWKSSHPIIVSMNSMNAGSVRTRTVASSLYNMFVQSASLISNNVYQPGDGLCFHEGNKVLAGIMTDIAIFNWAAKAWYIYRNRQKAKGNKRLDFRFLH